MRILVDLKAAFDGYAGIPQEARLLFACLRGLPSDAFQVDGLLQSDGVRLAVPDTRLDELPVDERVYQTARMIASFDHEIPENKWRRYRYAFDLRRYYAGLDKQAEQDVCLELGGFETDAFSDFLWSRLFDKSLRPQDRSLVCRGAYRTLSVPRSHLHVIAMRALARKGGARFLTLDTSDYDVLIVQSPIPAKVSSGTRLIVRYHDAAPLVMTHTINNKQDHLDAHFHALKLNVQQGAYFACVSEASRGDLLKLFPEAEPRAHVVHNIVSDHYFDAPEKAGFVSDILSARRSTSMPERADQPIDDDGSPFLLAVSTLEPRKNHLALIRAWEALRRREKSNLKLVLVGSAGWDSEDILQAMRPWMQSGQIIHLTAVPADELRSLYRGADCVVCPSIFEGFGFSGAEALKSGAVLAASDLPVHREVYADAAVYFDPYDVNAIADALNGVLGTGTAAKSRREALRSAAKSVANRYDRDSLREIWKDLLTGQAAVK